MRRYSLRFFISCTLISGAAFFLTLCPTVEFIDSGELALACKNLGVAHPTGYPLYTLLGRLASIFPLGDLIFRVNLLSLLFTALASGCLYLLTCEILRARVDDVFTHLLSSGIALFTTFCPIWWAQGTTNEVYSLNLLLLSVSIWCLFKFDNFHNDGARWLLLSIYSLGLCLANHLSAIYLFPGFLVIIIPRLRAMRMKAAVIITGLGFLLIPLTLYLVLPIRAAYKPFLNWGGVNDTYFLYKHISGWQYRVWMFDNPLEIFNNLPSKLLPVGELIWNQLAAYGVILLIIGILASAVHHRKHLIFAILVWIVNLIYVLNYDIGDIESYYLPMILVSSILIALGIQYLRERIFSPAGYRIAAILAASLSLILAVSNAARNSNAVDRRNRTYAKQGVIDLTNSMSEGGVAIVENWDFYSPWLYLRFEEGFRPDIILLDKELLRRSWYIEFIKRTHSDIYERSKQQFDEFLRQVAPFERNRPFDPNAIDKAYYAMLNEIIANESAPCHVYTNVFSDKKFLQGHLLVPDGILYRYKESQEFLETRRFEIDENYWEQASRRPDKRVAYLLSFYLRAFESRERYCRYFEHYDEAEYYRGIGDKTRNIVDRLNR